MKVLLAGSNGVVGRPARTLLEMAGHKVVGLGRRPADPADGSDYVQADLRSSGAVRAAVELTAPDAIVSLAGDLPDRLQGARLEAAYQRNDRVRLAATRNVVRAALAHDVPRLVVASMAFLYEPGGSAPNSETELLHTSGPEPIGPMASTTLQVEHLATGTAGIEGTVLRFGFLYGPGTWWSREGSLTTLLRRRRYPLIGDGTGVFSWLHVDDAAVAVAAAVDTEVTGTFNIVDDDAAPMHEWLPHAARVLDAPAPRRVPPRLAQLVAGAAPVYYATRMPGASNRTARQRLGWRPAHASWREGFSRALR